MNKCLKISLAINNAQGLLESFIQKNAKNFKIEGIAYLAEGQIKITACGSAENLDEFVDSLYKGYKDIKPSLIEVEPFLKDKDYRGIFRIIE